MNHNRDGSRNAKFILNRKRKLENSDSYNKRSRLAKESQSQNQNSTQDRWDQNIAHWSVSSSNFQTVQKPTRFSNEKVHNLEPLHTSPANHLKSRPTVYSANDRLKIIRSNTVLPTPIELNKSDVNSNSTYSKYSSPKSSGIARPSSLQERLNVIRNAPIKNQTLSPIVTTPSPFQYSSSVETTSPVRNVTRNLSQISPIKNNITDTEEPMDWSYINEKEVLTKITELRNEKIIKRVTPNSDFQEAVAKTLMDIPNNNTIFKNIYIVVDTNIFLTYLNVVEQILKIKINVSGVVSPIILIPWIVIQELDYLKESKSENKLRKNSRVAINFINRKLSSQDPQVKGQSVRDAAQQDFASRMADDGILHCCLQILEKHNRPMLLSNDINLRNKAMIQGVSSYSHNEILGALDPYREIGAEKNQSFDCSMVKKIELYFTHFFSFIIYSQLKQTYGNVLNSMNPDVRNPPWSLLKCMNLFKRYWQVIFCLVLQKQFLSAADEYIDFLNKHQDIEEMNTMQVKKFTDLGLAICIYVQNGLPDFFTSARDCITNVESIIKTLSLPEN